MPGRPDKKYMDNIHNATVAFEQLQPELKNQIINPIPKVDK